MKANTQIRTGFKLNQPRLLILRLHYNLSFSLSSVKFTWPSINLSNNLIRIEERIIEHHSKNHAIPLTIKIYLFLCIYTYNIVYNSNQYPFLFGKFNWISAIFFCLSLIPSLILSHTFLSSVDRLSFLNLANMNIP